MPPMTAMERLHAFVSRNIIDPEIAKEVIAKLDKYYGILRGTKIKFSDFGGVDAARIGQTINGYSGQAVVDKVMRYSCATGVFRPFPSPTLHKRFDNRPWQGARFSKTLVTLLAELYMESLREKISDERWNEMYDLLNEPLESSERGKTVDRLYNLLRNSLGPAFPLTAISEVRHAIFHPIAFWLAAQIAQYSKLARRLSLLIEEHQLKAPIIGSFDDAPKIWTAITF